MAESTPLVLMTRCRLHLDHCRNELLLSTFCDGPVSHPGLQRSRALHLELQSVSRRQAARVQSQWVSEQAICKQVGWVPPAMQSTGGGCTDQHGMGNSSSIMCA
jgi:hypothetical protein